MRKVVLVLLFLLLTSTYAWLARAIGICPETSAGYLGCNVLGAFLISDNMQILCWRCMKPGPILFFWRRCHHALVLLLRLADFCLFDLVQLVQFSNYRGFVLDLLVYLRLQKFWFPGERWGFLFNGLKAILLLLNQVVGHGEVGRYFYHLRLNILQLFLQRSVL